MSEQVRVTKIQVQNAQDSFLQPIKLNIFFEVFSDLCRELEWKVVYVGSADSPAHDQVLEQFIMNQLSTGEMTFEINVNPPDPSKIPPKELCGASVIMICAFYRSQEFFRCSYFIYNGLPDDLADSTPEQEVEVEFSQLNRYILADKPRIRETDILWDADFYQPALSDHSAGPQSN